MKIEIKYDSREIDAFIRNTSKGELNKAVARALNRTGLAVKTEVARVIKRVPAMSKVPTAEIKKALPPLKRARASQSITEQEEIIGASTKGISLRYFDPRQTAQGVQVKIPEGTRLAKHAFFARGKGAGRDSTFRRVRVRKPGTEKRRSAGGHELPIERQSYKGVAQMLSDHSEQIQDLAQTRFIAELTRSLKFYGSRKR